jgi:hypothetical protein
MLVDSRFPTSSHVPATKPSTSTVPRERRLRLQADQVLDHLRQRQLGAAQQVLAGEQRAVERAPPEDLAHRQRLSCTAQPLPSGSLKKTNEPQGNCWTSLTSTPRSTSSARAAPMSGTTICSP